jgi:peptidoglycan/xylan/chitin deacetylase (PgdA/CDA1 family)
MSASHPFPGGARAAISLTYDDGPAEHLDHAMPDLEQHGLRGTFYVPTGPRPRSWHTRLADWRVAVARGHEIGNHTVHHPCGLDEHKWVSPEYALQTYTLERMRAELIQASHDLESLFGARRPHSYAYTCFQDWVGRERTSYRPLVAELFPAARGGGDAMIDPADCDWSFVPSYLIDSNVPIDAMRGLIDEAINRHAWIVFTLHGVDGGHSLNVTRADHQAICAHVTKRREDLWCGTFLAVARHIRQI